eukprot:6176897-Pleurochrysis_carterae.AAC.5
MVYKVSTVISTIQWWLEQVLATKFKTGIRRTAGFPNVAASSKREYQHRSEYFDFKFRIFSKSNIGNYT